MQNTLKKLLVQKKNGVEQSTVLANVPTKTPKRIKFLKRKGAGKTVIFGEVVFHQFIKSFVLPKNTNYGDRRYLKEMLTNVLGVEMLKGGISKLTISNRLHYSLNFVLP